MANQYIQTQPTPIDNRDTSEYKEVRRREQRMANQLKEGIAMKKSTALQITRKTIVVHQYPDGELFFEPRIYGIFPRERKEHLLITSPCLRRIAIYQFASHGGTVYVHPAAWRAILESSTVVASDFSPCQISPEIERQAYASVTSICSCPAVVEGFVHPDHPLAFTAVA